MLISDLPVWLVKDKNENLTEKEAKKMIISWCKKNLRLLKRGPYDDGSCYYVLRMQNGKDNWQMIDGGLNKFEILMNLKKLINQRIKYFQIHEPEEICDCFWKEFENE